MNGYFIADLDLTHSIWTGSIRVKCSIVDTIGSSSKCSRILLMGKFSKLKSNAGSFVFSSCSLSLHLFPLGRNAYFEGGGMPKLVGPLKVQITKFGAWGHHVHARSALN